MWIIGISWNEQHDVMVKLDKLVRYHLYFRTEYMIIIVTLTGVFTSVCYNYVLINYALTLDFKSN